MRKVKLTTAETITANVASLKRIPSAFIDEATRNALLLRASLGEDVYAYHGPYRYTIWDGGLPPDTERRIVLLRLVDVPCDCCGERRCDCTAARCERCECCLIHCYCQNGGR